MEDEIETVESLSVEQGPESPEFVEGGAQPFPTWEEEEEEHRRFQAYQATLTDADRERLKKERKDWLRQAKKAARESLRQEAAKYPRTEQVYEPPTWIAELKKLGPIGRRGRKRSSSCSSISVSTIHNDDDDDNNIQDKVDLVDQSKEADADAGGGGEGENKNHA